jgi:hypothetical protein
LGSVKSNFGARTSQMPVKESNSWFRPSRRSKRYSRGH